MKRERHLAVKPLIKLCKGIEDPRRRWGNKRHELTTILIIALLGILCGCETWEEIRDYGNRKRRWLRTFLALPNGIPSESTFQRVFARIRPEALESVYRAWVKPYVGNCVSKQICVDGKTVCGVERRSDARLHMVSAWVREDNITLGQLQTAEKSNEITAIPQLLESLDIRGGTVTIDAMGCQKEIARTIRNKEAQYVLAVKENQPTLHAEIKEYFDWAMTDAVEKHHLSQFRQRSVDHGRTTRWHVVSTTDTVWFEPSAAWAGLRSFVMVECTWADNEKRHTQRRYYISSLDTDAAVFHRYIRGHWSIENQLHWVLDVAFHEDACAVHKGFAPQNLALLRKFSIAMLKAETSVKASIARKRKIAGWDDDYAFCLISPE